MSVELSRWKHLPPPPAFAQNTTSTSKPSNKAVAAASASYTALKAKRAWDFAIAPAKSLPMQAFMLYMSGGGVQIFSMGIVFMLLVSPFKNLAGINIAFAPFAPTPSPNDQAQSDPKAMTALPLQKIVYLLCNVLTLALGLWKCKQMGLLPTGTADWLGFETRGPPPEMMLR